MRRVDRRTNALPDRPTNRPTDTASYRGALSHLKIKERVGLPESGRFSVQLNLFIPATSMSESFRTLTLSSPWIQFSANLAFLGTLASVEGRTKRYDTT